MSNALTVSKIDDKELVTTLQNSLYSGAKEESIRMVLSYCNAAGLDPMQKPVHIVPMYDSKSKQMKDVIMPGIGLYRTNASRTGEMAGISEPEFGEDVFVSYKEEKYFDNYGKEKTRQAMEVTYPKWCKVTVSRQLKNGTIVDFTAKELWIENYATAGKDTKMPNSMWSKRPYAQLAKCAEAQALRKAFPEVGSSPTADEMEGKTIDITDTASHTINQPHATPKQLPMYSQDAFDTNFDKWASAIRSGRMSANQIIATVETKGILSDDQKMAIVEIEHEMRPNVIDAETGEILTAQQG